MLQYLPICISYLIGALPFGLFMGWLAGLDVRKLGSGNIGATNVLRTCGWKWGVPALMLDMLKGFLPVWAVKNYAEMLSIEQSQVPLISVLTALACIVGHTFPVYLKFKGGKGVATSGGVFLALMPQVVGIAIASFVIIVAITRYISVGSTVAAVLIVVLHHFFSAEPYGADLPVTLLAWLVSLLVIIRHKSNYVRLFAGTENKLGGKKTPAA